MKNLVLLIPFIVYSLAIVISFAVAGLIKLIDRTLDALAAAKR